MTLLGHKVWTLSDPHHTFGDKNVKPVDIFAFYSNYYYISLIFPDSLQVQCDLAGQCQQTIIEKYLLRYINMSKMFIKVACLNFCWVGLICNKSPGNFSGIL